MLGKRESVHRLPGPPVRSFSSDNAGTQRRHRPVRSPVPQHGSPPSAAGAGQSGPGSAPTPAGPRPSAQQGRPGCRSRRKAEPGDLRSEGRRVDGRLPLSRSPAVSRAEHSPPADKLSAPSEPWPGRLHLQRAPETRPRTLIALLATSARPEGRGQPSTGSSAAASRYQRVSLLRRRGPDAILGGRRSHLTTPPSAAATARSFPPSEEGTAAVEGRSAGGERPAVKPVAFGG